MLDTIKPQLNKAFLDSGAYSVVTGLWDKLPIDEYIAFTDKYHDHFTIISVPDVIGDTKATMANVEYFLKRTKVPKSKIANVYHVNSCNINIFPEIIQRSIDAGIGTISLGGLVGFPKKQAIVALEWIFNYLHKNNIKIKTHIFGGGDPMIVNLFRPDSIDSSSFLHAAKGFSYQLYDLENWKMARDKFVDIRTSKSREWITDESVDYLMELAPLVLPFDPKANDRAYVRSAIEGIQDSEKIALVNGLKVREFEVYTREKLGYDFHHYVSYRSFDYYKHPYTYAAFREIWKDRPLQPYLEFWKVRGRNLEKLINMFGDLDEN